MRKNSSSDQWYHGKRGISHFYQWKKWHPWIRGAIVVERGKNGSPDQSGAIDIVVVYPPFERGKNGTLGSVVVVYPPFVGGK